MLLLHTNVLGHLVCDLQLRVQTVDEKKTSIKIGNVKSAPVCREKCQIESLGSVLFYSLNETCISYGK